MVVYRTKTMVGKETRKLVVGLHQKEASPQCEAIYIYSIDVALKGVKRPKRGNKDEVGNLGHKLAVNSGLR